MNGYWSPRGKIIQTPTVTKNADGQLCVDLSGLIAEAMPLFPHYSPPEVQVDEDGQPKVGRVVLTE